MILYVHSKIPYEDGLNIYKLPDENIDNSLTHIVSPTRTNRSVLFYRMNTTNESIRMPLIGRTILHEEGLLLMEEWINSLETVCP